MTMTNNETQCFIKTPKGYADVYCRGRKVRFVASTDKATTWVGTQYAEQFMKRRNIAGSIITADDAEYEAILGRQAERREYLDSLDTFNAEGF